jgi:hypothetical protein
LPNRALVILEKLAEARADDFVFPGQRPGQPLSNMAMEMVLRRMEQDAVTVHGFRSACGERNGQRSRTDLKSSLMRLSWNEIRVRAAQFAKDWVSAAKLLQ